MHKRTIVITKSNSITLPKKLREQLGLQSGECLEYDVLVNGAILLVRKECCQQKQPPRCCQTSICQKSNHRQ